MLRKKNNLLLIKILIVLALIQTVRAAAVWGMRSLYAPSMLFCDFILIIIGACLYMIWKPDRKSLGLGLQGLGKRAKLLYAAISLILLILAVTPLVLYSGNLTDIIGVIDSIILFPVFEELLFRGFLWNRLETSGFIGLKAYLTTTVLFGLWHLGYWDIIFYRANQNFTDVDMGNIMLFKVLTGIGYGIITGFMRLKTKNTYASLMIHSLLNIFGR